MNRVDKILDKILGILVFLNIILFVVFIFIITSCITIQQTQGDRPNVNNEDSPKTEIKTPPKK